MSKLPKNFEKILLGVGGVAAIAFIAFGFMKSSAVETDFAHTTKPSGKNDPSIPEAEATARAVASLTTDLNIGQQEDNGNKVDLFVGIPLFADKNNLNQPIDPNRGRQIHPDIPNKWWLDTGADPSYANSPQRDDDSDGFSNLDEFKGNTNPTDAKSFPSLVDKLAYVKDESIQWYVVFGYADAGKWSPKLEAAVGGKLIQNRVSAENMLSPGDVFFADKDFKGRFKFIGISKKTVHSNQTNTDTEVDVAEYEELKPNKKGLKYESQQNLPKPEIPSKAYYDRTAVLDLQAVGASGKEFKVEEGTTFALPPGGEEKKYLLKSVSPAAIEVEYTDSAGQKQTKTIQKGAK